MYIYILFIRFEIATVSLILLQLNRWAEQPTHSMVYSIYSFNWFLSLPHNNIHSWTYSVLLSFWFTDNDRTERTLSYTNVHRIERKKINNNTTISVCKQHLKNSTRILHWQNQRRRGINKCIMNINLVFMYAYAVSASHCTSKSYELRPQRLLATLLLHRTLHWACVYVYKIHWFLQNYIRFANTITRASVESLMKLLTTLLKFSIFI